MCRIGNVQSLAYGLNLSKILTTNIKMQVRGVNFCFGGKVFNCYNGLVPYKFLVGKVFKYGHGL